MGGKLVGTAVVWFEVTVKRPQVVAPMMIAAPEGWTYEKAIAYCRNNDTTLPPGTIVNIRVTLEE